MHVFHLTFYSHFFKLTRIQARALPAINRFCMQNAIKQWVKENRRNVLKVTKVFAVRTRDKKEYRFHIGQLEDFYKALQMDHITSDMYTTDRKPMYVPTNVYPVVQSGWVLKDYQEEAHTFIVDESTDDNHSRLVAIQTGGGKAEVLSSRIKVPGGWSTMGDMQVGTEVIAKDGTTTIVTGVYPQPIKPVFRITFIDGRYTECCAEHLWRIHIANDTHQWLTTSTRNIEAMLKMPSLRNRLYIDLCDSEQNEDVDLPIDPYVLGVILGDGHVTDNSITISHPDTFIRDKVADLINQLQYIINRKVQTNKCLTYAINGVTYADSLIHDLKELGLDSKRSWEKFVPEQYLNGSTRQRLALLQGLMDTDGTITDHGTISYSSASEQLARDVQYLVRSLGGIARISTRYTKYTYQGEKKQGRIAYQVNIRYKKPEELFTLPKKKERANDNNQYAASLKLRIKEVELIGYEYTQCISIAHPDKLYITNDFIVTHNTVTALACTQTLKTRTLIVVLSGYVDKWVQDIEKTIVVKKGDIVVVQGGKSMKDLTYSENTAKYIVISLNTIKNYFKAYEEHPGRIEDDGYAYPPEELCERLDIGSIIIDEVHQHLHAVYKLLTYTHVPKVIALSATLISDDVLIKHIQHQMFPREIRFDKVKMDQYIRCYATSYFFNDINKEKIRTTEFGSNTYSHNAFEKSVLRRHHVVENYMKLINNLLHTGYIEHYKHGDKAAIYVSSIAMADYVTQWFKRKYPDLDVRRYVEQDPYENVIDADIRITTVLSAGTAIDIPNLVAVIMTINMKSSVFNLQTLGRLRKIPDRVVKFYWIYCSQLDKHQLYHNHRKEIFQDRVESIKEFHYPYGL